MNMDSGSCADLSQKPAQFPCLHRDAAGGRAPVRPGHVQEYGTAALSHPRAPIVVDLDDEVVEPVLAPQAIAWFIGRAAERTVIPAVRRVLAPGEVRADAPDRQ